MRVRYQYFNKNPLFFRCFWRESKLTQSDRDLTFGTEGYRFESYRVCSSHMRPLVLWLFSICVD